MIDFLKTLFGTKHQEKHSPQMGTPHKPTPGPSATEPMGRKLDPSALETRPVPVTSSSNSRNSKQQTDLYFEAMSKLQGAISRHDYVAAAGYARESFNYIPGFVKETAAQFGRFDIGSIPAIERGGRVLALVGDRDGLLEMQQLLERLPELEPWLGFAQASFEDLEHFAGILKAVEQSPGCLQTDLKRLMNLDDGTNIGTLVSYLEKAGRLGRVKIGKSYSLHLPGSQDFPKPLEKRVIGSHRQGASIPSPIEIDISKLDYVPLPRSPDRWGEAQVRQNDTTKQTAKDLFAILDADWHLSSTEKIPQGERPDTAYRAFYPSAAGLFAIDDLGKAEGIGSSVASVLRYDQEGRIAVRAGLEFDLYRMGIHPVGRGLIALARDGILHAYDEGLKTYFETDLKLAPEISAIRRRFDIPDNEFKNHLRCVALSKDSSRYLFTIVDEAWCISKDGKALWGVKLPMKEGWSTSPPPSRAFGTSDAIERALKVMDLSFPFTPEDLKGRYRSLARQWHPDLNASDSAAAEKMVALNASMEVLTGVDGSAIPTYAASYGRGLAGMAVNVSGLSLDISVSIIVSEKFASDWIYAAGFASDTNGAYLAGYSGRVVYVDENGKAVRVYDIGAVPRQIVDTGEFLYLLTSTRLYVLKDDQLHALIDTFDGGDLIVAAKGFALLEKKQARFFAAGGTYQGSVLSKDPIRRIYQSSAGLVVETRQHKAVLSGAPSWLI